MVPCPGGFLVAFGAIHSDQKEGKKFVQEYLDSLYFFDVETNAFSLLKPKGNEIPCGRHCQVK
jgi:hypothetical protein